MLKIITDSGSDLPLDTINKYDIEVFPLCIIDGNDELFIGEDINRDKLFENMKNGQVYKTSQASPAYILEKFKEFVINGYDVLYLPISSGISGTYETALSAKNEVLKSFPHGKIEVMDTKAATMGQGMITIKAAMLDKKGLSIEEIVKELEYIIENQIHLFTVGNLEYLYRGGRLSKTAKIIGGLLDMKPVLELERKEGKIVPLDKARGFHGFLRKLKGYVNKLSKDGKFDPNQTVIICHGKWEDEAKMTKDFFVEELKVTESNIEILDLGCVIGSHTGPEVLTVFFSSDPEALRYLEL